MADSIPTIKVSEDVYIDVYAEAGLSVGTPIEIINIGSHYVRTQEVTDQPADGDDSKGLPLTFLNEPNAILTAESGSNKIWACGIGGDTLISVVDLS